MGAIAADPHEATVAALAGARIGEWLDARMPRRHLRRGSILVVIVVGVSVVGGNARVATRLTVVRMIKAPAGWLFDRAQMAGMLP